MTYACHVIQHSGMFAMQRLVNAAISTNLTTFTRIGLELLVPCPTVATSNIMYMIDTQYMQCCHQRSYAGSRQANEGLSALLATQCMRPGWNTLYTCSHKTHRTQQACSFLARIKSSITLRLN